MRIAFITDLHFGRLTVGAVDALLNDLNTQNPDLILIGGDVTQRAFASQYRECQKFLAQLKSEWLCIIGNHDVPAWNLFERFTNPYGAYQKFITRELNPTWVNNTIAVQGLNSARRMMRDWAWEQGEVSAQQIAMTHDFFAQHPDKTKIVMVHHPLTHPPSAPTRLLVRNYQNALDGFVAAGADMILTGHLHLASAVNAQSVMPDLQKPLWLVQGGTATCDRLRGEGNSYWMIDLTMNQPQFALRKFSGKQFD